MNNYYEQEIYYRLLKILSGEPRITQRDMANKTPYTYILTTRGLEEKSRLTTSFLKRKLSEYEEIRELVMELAREAEEEVEGLPEFVRLGRI